MASQSYVEGKKIIKDTALEGTGLRKRFGMNAEKFVRTGSRPRYVRGSSRCLVLIATPVREKFLRRDVLECPVERGAVGSVFPNRICGVTHRLKLSSLQCVVKSRESLQRSTGGLAGSNMYRATGTREDALSHDRTGGQRSVIGRETENGDAGY